MKQKTIRKHHERIQERIKNLRRLIRVEEANAQTLREQCEHPSAYFYTAIGELGRRCPDCGWAT